MVPVQITGAGIYDLNGQIVGARAMVAALRADA
jgi:ribosomal protein S12 methylthiotransferase